jgi:HlyD family secretion protein
VQGNKLFLSAMRFEYNYHAIAIRLQTHVSKGMTLTTRYIISSSLYELLFDKVDDWINPKQLASRN